MKVPKVTVLMAVYNGEKYLRKAIESILNQSFTDFEFLIVNDGSTDDSGEIFRTYTDARIRILTNDNNIGLAGSLNRGLKAARGEYVARIDADDVALSQRLDAQNSFLDANPDIILVGSGYEIIDETGKVLETVEVLGHPLAIRFWLLFDNPICHSSVMFRRSAALEAKGYAEGVQVGQDFAFWNRLACVGNITQINRPLVKLRLHEESISRSAPINTKSQYVLTVVRNIYRLTARKIPFDVANSLYGQSTRRFFDKSTIRQAYEEIGNCLAILMESESKNRKTRFLLLSQCLKKLECIANLTPTSHWRAFRTGLWLALLHSPTAIFTRKFLRFTWRMAVPEGLRKHFLPYYPAWVRKG